jgi:hypothetical protein
MYQNEKCLGVEGGEGLEKRSARFMSNTIFRKSFVFFLKRGQWISPNVHAMHTFLKFYVQKSTVVFRTHTNISEVPYTPLLCTQPRAGARTKPRITALLSRKIIR